MREPLPFGKSSPWALPPAHGWPAVCRRRTFDGGLVQNGGFDNLPAGYDGTAPYFTTTTLPDWTVTQGNVDIVKNTYWATPNNNSGYSLDLSGTTSGWIQQQITPTASGTYKLSFWYGANPDGAPSVKVLFKQFGDEGANWFSPQSSGTPGNANWQDITPGTYTLTKGQTYYLEFGSLTPGYYGPTLDGVALTAVPEPYQYGLASLLGLFGLVITDCARRRKFAA